MGRCSTWHSGSPLRRGGGCSAGPAWTSWPASRGYSHPVGRDGPDPDLLRLRQAVASLAGELGRHRLALALWSELVDAVPVEQAAWAALAASESALHLGRTDDGRRLLARARAAAGTDPVVEVAAAAQEAALEHWLAHRPAAASAAARRSVLRARALDTQPGRAATLPPQARRAYLRALLAATEVGLLSGRPDDVVAFSGEAARVASAGDERARIRALTDGALGLRWTGRNADAEDQLRRAWEDSRRLVLPQPTLEVGAVFAKVLYSRGRLAEAVAVLAECRELGDRLGEYCPARAISVVVTHLVDHSLGPWQRAARGLLDAAAAEADPHYRLHAWLERASMLARLDPRRSAADVRASVARARADAADGGCGRCRLEVSARAVDAVARLGDLTLAGSMLDEWTDTARSADPADVAMQWWGQQARATLAAARGELAEAEAARRRLAEEAERQGQRIEALWVRLDLGAQVGAVDREGAAAVLRTAGQDAELMGAMTEQQVADRALRALGVRTWRRGTAVRGEHVAPELTDREREVARLAASGASNPEIAAALFLSRKTVERHLSNSLAKLGLRNRVELAAVLGRETGDSPRPEGAHR